MSQSAPERDGDNGEETLAEELEERVEGMHEGEIADADDIEEAFLST